MKKILLYSILFQLIIGLSFPIAAQDKENNTPEEEIIRKSVENKKFNIAVDFAMPASMPSRYLTGNYSLIVNNDSVTIDLPYFGVAYSMPYGADGSLKYKGLYENYKSKYNKKKKQFTLNFIIRKPEDSYVITINIWLNGKTDIHIRPNNKQSISFTGELKN
ncbi:DUF4251 domain-containing protein [Coprobacter tertius]|uniref:DUF4251 domain-containing protein n=1 Tax=Coprobacter tertius TaxID=2944915 RepID=A0ABT1MH15_9BACT|nr:DUF4251 domain-containing protein [Coprobacter tertius]MCP9610536.1 DUF4251 domain-containing protein [Coprobacter tertius]